MRPDTEYWDSMAAHGADAAVIDPSDRRGHKNAYITALRTHAILEQLGPVQRTVLDFGCGSGGMLRELAAAGHGAVGVDISRELLALARQRFAPAPALVLYDGARLPLADASVDAACCYVVLNHVLDDALLQRVLAELWRVIRPGGRLVAVEQIRRASRYEPRLHTHRRSRARWQALFDGAGFRLTRAETVRFGHFPLTYLIRYGLVPRRWHAAIERLELRLGRLHPVPWLDYADVLFVLEKG